MLRCWVRETRSPAIPGDASVRVAPTRVLQRMERATACAWRGLGAPDAAAVVRYAPTGAAQIGVGVSEGGRIAATDYPLRDVETRQRRGRRGL